MPEGFPGPHQPEQQPTPELADDAAWARYVRETPAEGRISREDFDAFQRGQAEDDALTKKLYEHLGVPNDDQLDERSEPPADTRPEQQVPPTDGGGPRS